MYLTTWYLTKQFREDNGSGLRIITTLKHVARG